MSWTVLLVAHGTVEDLADMPAFLGEIRRGRPASAELVEEMRARYRHVGGSPLLKHTREQAAAVEQLVGIPTRVAMRLWHPKVSEVCADLGPGDDICLVPLAPFSVTVYEQAARHELSKMDSPPRLHCIPPWGSMPALIEAIASQIEEHRKQDPTSRDEEAVVLTAHSLPMVVIERGDTYAKEFDACCRAIESRLGSPIFQAYQSEGADGGRWLGPSLLRTLQKVKREGFRGVVVAPVGFPNEHIETLYDLDVETKLHAEALELELCRVPALGTQSGLVETLANLVRGVVEQAEADRTSVVDPLES